MPVSKLPPFKPNPASESWFGFTPIQMPSSATVEKMINVFSAAFLCSIPIAIIYYMNQQISDLSQQVSILSQQKGQLESDLSELQLNFKNVNSENERCASNFAQINEQFGATEAARVIAKANFEFCSGELQAAEYQLDNFADWQGLLQGCIDASSDTVSTDLMPALIKATDVWEKCDFKQREIDRLKVTWRAITNDYARLEGELSRTTNQCTMDKNSLQGEVDGQKAINNGLNTDKQGLEKNIAQLQEDLNTCKKHVSDHEKTIKGYEKIFGKVKNAVQAVVKEAEQKP